MRAVALLALGLGLLSAAAGIGVAIIGFAPIPFGDFIDFVGNFFNVGGWDGYRFPELYARHNEHRLVLPRLWFLADLALFDGTQAFLIAVTVLSSAAHAAALAFVFRSLGHRGPLLWAFAAAAFGALLSPAQWENLVWGFQVQFVQVWLFATLAFLAISRSEGRRAWLPVIAAIAAGLASTYSMANGLLVWPLLVVLALWSRVRGGPLWLLLAAAAAVVAIEVAGFRAHPGHGDPAQTIGQPLLVLRYAFRYLANGVGAIGTRGQEILGAALFFLVAAMAVDALLRPRRYQPAHAVLLAVAGFVIGAALVTALGRVPLGLGQANATRYATPSFIFLVVCLGLLLDRLVRVEAARARVAGTVVGVILLLVPGLVDGLRHLSVILEERDARIDAVVTYLAGGYRPEELRALYPITPGRPFRVLTGLEQAGWGPFADPGWFRPPRPLLENPPKPEAPCRGYVDVAATDPVVGVSVIGWATAADSADHPDWILVTDARDSLVAWGASRRRRDDVGAVIGTAWRARGFHATGSRQAEPPLTAVGVFSDGRSCLLAAGIAAPPRFLSTLPEGSRPATEGGWTVLEGQKPDRVGPEPPAAVLPAVGVLGANSRLLARIDVPPADAAAVLAVPVRTVARPRGVVLRVSDAETGEVIDQYRFLRPSADSWNWLLIPASAEPRMRGRALRIEINAADPRPLRGVAVGRPYWLPAGAQG